MEHNLTAHALAPIALPEFSGDDLPTEFPLLRFGINKSLKGIDELVTEHSGPWAVALQKALGRDLILDTEHKSLHVEPGESFPIAADFDIEDRGAAGIWAKVKKWHAHGIEAVKKLGLKYISPYVLRKEATGEVVGILSAALTHAPDLLNPPNIFVPHSSGIEQAREVALRLLGAEHNQTMEDTTMPKWLIELLGLKEGASEDQVKTAVHSLKESASKPPEKLSVIPASIITALGLQDGANETLVVGTIHSLKGTAAGATELAQRIATLEGKTTEQEAEKLITQAHSDGKLTDAMVEWANGEVKAKRFEQLKGFLEKAPVIVPLGMRKPLSAAEHAAHGRGDDAAVLDDDQREVNRQLGVSDARWTKHFAGSKS